jgi:hypothetical protein
MKHLQAPYWQTVIEELRNRLNDALDQIADTIKDSMLDWGEPEEDETQFPERTFVSLARSEFVEAMRAKVEDALARLADVIDDAPTGRLNLSHEAAVAEIVTKLCCEALDTGIRLRPAGKPRNVPLPAPAAGEWARRFRQMHALDHALMAVPSPRWP